MWGDSIKLSLQSDTTIHNRNWNFVFPKGVWCDIFNITQPCVNMTESGYSNMTADVGAFIREGHIIPFQNGTDLITNQQVHTVADL
jgi:alpha-glucosidase (family GH31 glycosyl hydrolase)